MKETLTLYRYNFYVRRFENAVEKEHVALSRKSLLENECEIMQKIDNAWMNSEQRRNLFQVMIERESKKSCKYRARAEKCMKKAIAIADKSR